MIQADRSGLGRGSAGAGGAGVGAGDERSAWRVGASGAQRAQSVDGRGERREEPVHLAPRVLTALGEGVEKMREGAAKMRRSAQQD